MTLRHRGLLALALMALAIPLHAQQAQPAGGIAVSPGKQTLDLSAGEDSGSIRVFNLSDEPLAIRTEVHHFTTDEANEVVVIPPTPQSLDQWLVVNPVKFTIPPDGQQVVRFAIRPRAEPKPGEHRAMVFFNRDAPPDPEATIAVNVRVGAAIYALVDPVERIGRLDDLELMEIGPDGLSLGLTLASEGNALVRASARYAIWPVDRDPGERAATLLRNGQEDELAHAVAVGRIPARPVFPGLVRTLKTRIAADFEPGRAYRLRVVGDLAGRSIDRVKEFIVE
jgi:hypothetical protein